MKAHLEHTEVHTHYEEKKEIITERTEVEEIVEEEIARRAAQAPEKQPTTTTTQYSEKVQITEIPVDETDSVTESFAIVTQPKDIGKLTEKLDENEEIIIVDETKLKKRRKTKKKITGEEDKEEEIVSVIEKTIKSHKPIQSESKIHEEKTDDIAPLEVPFEKETLLQTPSSICETYPLGQTAEISITKGSQEKAVPNLLPHTTFLQEQTTAEEKELYHEKFAPTMAIAKPSIKPSEGFQVTEQSSEVSPESFETVYKPTTGTANLDYVQNESITVKQVLDVHTVKGLETMDVKDVTASVLIDLLEATNITETETAEDETDFVGKEKPKTAQAKKTIPTKESLIVTETQENTMESEFVDQLRIVPVSPKINVDTMESLTVSEVTTEIKPEKHLPESFVATEVAKETVLPQKQLTNTEMYAPELPGEYLPDRLPPSQKADLNVAAKESVSIEQTHPHEKETFFDTKDKPDSVSATENIITHKSVVITTTDTQQPHEKIPDDTTTSQKAIVEYDTNESLLTSSVVLGESEKEYTPGLLPDTNIADSSISCLTVSSVQDVSVQEKESELEAPKAPSMVLAERKINTKDYLSVSEIETGDLPSELTDTLKFKTDQATSDIATEVAKEITETQTHEKEDDYSSVQPIPKSVELTYSGTHEIISVTEQKTMESEDYFKTEIFPETHTSTEASTHFLPTTVKEEIILQSSSEDLKLVSPSSDTAKLQQDTTHGISITEILSNDAPDNFVPDVTPKSQQITITMEHMEGIKVADNQAAEKEGKFDAGQIPCQFVAQPEVEVQNAAITFEAETNVSPESITEEKPTESVAAVSHDLLGYIEVQETETADKEHETAKPKQPDAQKANVDLEEASTEITVLQPMINEKESEMVIEQTSGVIADRSISKHRVPLQAETEILIHAEELDDEGPITGRAKKYARPFTELIITESIATDVEKVLPKDIFPYEKTAKQDFRPALGISVTETTTEDKEEALSEHTVPQSQQADLTVSGNTVALQEETMHNISEGELAKIAPKTDTAEIRQDVSHSVIQTDAVPGETSGVHDKFISPETKKSTVNFEEGEGISVLQIQEMNKEKPFSELQAPQEAHGSIDIIPHTIAVQSVTTTNITTTDMDLTKPDATATALPNAEMLQGLILSESIAGEKEGIFESAVPELRSAHADFNYKESISVSSIVASDTEKPFKPDEISEGHTATVDVTGQPTAESTETYTDDTVANLTIEQRPEGKASQEQTELQSLIQTITTIGESEITLDDVQHPSEKVAHPQFSESYIPSVQETTAAEKENIFEKDFKPDQQQAQPYLDLQEHVERTEIHISDTIKDLTLEVTDKPQAFVDHQFYESILQSQPIIGEKESTFADTPFDKKTASFTIDEHKSVEVLEVTEGGKEAAYDKEQVPQLQSAHMAIDELESIEKAEVLPHESVTDVTSEKPTSVQAQYSHSLLQPIVHSETTASENESPLNIQSTDLKTATAAVDEDLSVIVKSIVLGFKEADLSPETLPDSQRVNVDLTESKPLASQSITLTESVPEVLKLDENVEALASIETCPHISVVSSETLATESEQILVKDELENLKQAERNIESLTALSVSHVLSNEIEQPYKHSDITEGKNATLVIDAHHQSAVQEETQISFSPSDLNKFSPESKTAILSQDEQTSLIVQQENTLEAEGEFKDSITAPQFKPTVAMEEVHPTQNVTETYPHEKEKSLDAEEAKHTSTATMDIDVLGVADNSEIFGIYSPQAADYKTPDQFQAHATQTPHEALVQSEVCIGEKEQEHVPSTQQTDKTAIIKVEENVPLVTSEITTTEKESVLVEEMLPTGDVATYNISGRIIAETAEVLVNELSSKMADKAGHKPENAQLSFTEEKSTHITTTIPMEKEQDLQQTVHPAAVEAEQVVLEQNATQATEIQTSTDVEDIHPEKPIESKVSPAQIPFESLITSQVDINEVPGILKPQKTSPEQGSINFTISESITATENIAHEREDTYTYQDTETQTAYKNIEPVEAIYVKEIGTNEKENYFQPESATGNKISPEFLTHETHETLAVTTQDTFLPLKDESVPQGKAEKVPSFYEPLVVEEKIIHDKEHKLDESIVEQKTADFSFLMSDSIEVTDVKTEYKEKNLETFKLPESTHAFPETTPHNVTEVFLPESLYSLEQIKQTKVEDIRGQVSQVPYEGVNVSECTFEEKEQQLDQERPLEQQGTVTLSENVYRSLQTTETVTEAREQDLQTSQPKQMLAKQTLSELIPTPQASETAQLDSYLELAIDQQQPLKARQRQDYQEGIIQEKPYVDETSVNLDVHPVNKNIANLSVGYNTELYTTEVNVAEQESTVVITGHAKDQTVSQDITGKNAAQTEYVVPLTHTSMFLQEQPTERVAKESISSEQFGLLVTEQRSTGELESVLPDQHKPAMQTVVLSIEDISSNLQISEIHSNEREGESRFDQPVEKLSPDLVQPEKVTVSSANKKKKPEERSMKTEEMMENEKVGADIIEDVEAPSKTIKKRKTPKKAIPEEEKPKDETKDTEQDVKAKQKVKEKLIPIKLEIKKVEPQKLIISKPMEESINLAEIKLKKPKPAKKKEITPSKLPKFLLKSRIKFVDFPPLSESEVKPQISTLEPTFKQNGILSRNMKEAAKLKKTKPRKLKEGEDTLKDLEKIDKELEDLKKQEMEKVDEDLHKYEKKPKPKPEKPADETKPLILGKGKVPQDQQEDEEVKLKPIPSKTEEKPEDEATKPKVKDEQPSKPKKKRDKEEPQIQPFEPYDIDRPETEMESLDLPKPEEEVEEKPKDKKIKKPKSKKEKPLPETIEIPIEKGKPKPPAPEEETDVSFKKSQKPPPEDQPTEIKLKPFKKHVPDHEEEEIDKPELTLDEIPHTEAIPSDTELTEETERKVIKKKKRVIKRKPTDKPTPDEEKSIEETPTDELLEEIPKHETPDEHGEEEEETKPEEIPTIEKPTESEREEEEETTIDLETPSETTKKRKKVVKKKIPKDDIPEDVERDVALETPTKPKRTEKDKLKPIKLEITKIEPQKLVISKPTEEPVNLAEIKLKKPKPTKKKEITPSKLPKFLLKSRIKFVDFPPLSESEVKPQISTLEPTFKQNGILSRNMKEAAKLKKTKPRKLKEGEDTLKDLEKIDKELEDLKKQEMEKVDEELHKYEKKPKPKLEKPEDETKPLIIGKGKIPQEQQEDEEVKLKPIPSKPEEKPEDDVTKPKVKDEQPSQPKKKRDKEEPQIQPFEPYDIDRPETEMESLDLPKPEEEVEEKPKDKKIKKPKSKKEKPLPETIEIPIEKGKPKPPAPEEETDVSFKKSQKPPPEDQPTEIKLKPFKKHVPDHEEEEIDKPELTLDEIPHTEAIPSDTELTEETERKVIKKKKRVIKRKPTDKPTPDEEKSIEETPTDELLEEIPKHETPDEHGEEEEETKPEEIPTIEKPTESEREEEEETTIDLETPSETTKKRKKVVKKKIPKDDIPEDVERDVALETPTKPKRTEKDKLKPIKLEITKIEPQKLVISKPTEEPVNLAEIKLKKPKPTKKKEITPSKLPKFLLKSRIKFVDFPPLSESEVKPQISTLEPTFKQNGILSRNMKEAAKLKKTKPRKLKEGEDTLKDLEKIDKELEDLKKQEMEKVDEDLHKYEKKPKPKPEKPADETKPLILGKGKVPQDQQEDEEVKLKPIPSKTEEKPEDEATKPKVKDEQPSKPKKKRDKEEPQIQPFEPYDIDRPETEMESLDLPKPEEEVEEKPKDKKIKKPKSKKEKPLPETIEIPIEKGKPKPPAPEEETDVSFKKSQKPPPEDQPTEIKLKPFKKHVPDHEEEEIDKPELTLDEIPHTEAIPSDTELTEETERKVIKKKKRVIKRKPTDKPTPDEEKSIEETPTDELLEEIPKHETPDEHGEEEEETKPEEIPTIEKPTESEREEEEETTIDLETPSETTKKRKKVVKKKIPKDDIPEDVERDVALETPTKPKRTEKDKLKPIKLEITKIEPQKLVISKPTEEPVNLAEIKLKKPKPTKKKEIAPSKLPKFLLKSRITYVDFPPLSESEVKPQISVLEPTYKQNGILSRNMKEAAKLKKTKPRKLKEGEDTLKDLEKIDKELEDLKKQEMEKVDEDLHKYEKKPKPKPEKPADETKPIILGKGKIPQEQQEDEEVKLKPIPSKTEEKPEDEVTKPKVKDEQPSKPKKKRDKEEPQIQPFEPYDIDRPETEMESLDLPKPEEEVEEKPEDKKIKKPKSKKEKPLPETIEIPIEKGKPKPPAPEEETDVSFKKSQKPPPEDQPTEIKLKPFKKHVPDHEEEETDKPELTLDEIPHTEAIPSDTELTEETERKVIKKKKRVIKRKPTDKPTPDEEKSIEETPTDELREEIPKHETPDEHGEEEEETKPEEIPTIEKPTESEREEEEETTIDLETPSETTKKRKKVVKKKIPKDDIPEDVERDVALETPTKPKRTEKDKLKPIKLEITKIEPQKLVISKPTEEPVNLAEIKLKKPKPTKKKEITPSKLPKFLLKSRIKFVDFPPLSESEVKPQISTLEPTFKQNGILSRNMKEAAKLKKTKPRKLKEGEDTLKDLEKIDKELEDLKKQEMEKVDEDLHKYEKKPKPKPEKPADETKPLILGKGKVPQDQQEDEEVKLKPIPSKTEEKPEDEITKPKVKDEQPSKPKKEKDKEEPEIQPFEPYDVDRPETEIESLDLPKPEEEVEEKPKDKKIKKPKSKNDKPLPETIEIPIEKGKPKPPAPEEETDVSFKKSQKPPPEDQPTEIKLKPFKKHVPDHEEDETDKPELTLDEIPHTEAIPSDTELTEETERKVIKKKKRVIKRKPTDKPTPDEEKSIEETPTDELPEEIPKHETPDEHGEEEEETKPEEIPTIEKPTESEREEEEETTIDLETPSETTKKRKKVVKKKIPTEDIPEDVERDVAQETPAKPKRTQKDKLKPIKMEITKIEPQKLVISKPIEEPVNLAEIKLKKPKPTKQKEITASKLPKFLLKSRITFVDFPPLSESEVKPQISALEPTYKQNGILSRNIKEAAKLKKTKPRKIKEDEDTLKDLEKIDKELEDLKKQEMEKVDEDLHKYEKKPKFKPEKPADEAKPLIIGKGKIPQERQEDEEVKLKPIPSKPEEKPEDEETKPIVKDEQPSKPSKKKDKEEPELQPFEPYDFDRSETEIESPDLPKPGEELDEKPIVQKAKRSKSKKDKPSSEALEIPLGKEKPATEEEDISIKKSQKLLPEDKPTEGLGLTEIQDKEEIPDIKREDIIEVPTVTEAKELPVELKPLEQDTLTADETPVEILVLKKKKPKKDITPDENEVHLIAPKLKIPTVDETAEEIAIEMKIPLKPKKEENLPVEEILQREHIPAVDEDADEITIQKKVPVKTQDEEEPFTEETIPKKQVPSKDEEADEVTIQKKVAVKPHDAEEPFAEEVLPKKTIPSKDEDADEITIQKKIIVKSEDEEQPFTEETIPKKQVPSKDEDADEITIQKKIIIKPQDEEEPFAEEIMPRKQIPPKDEESDEIFIRKLVPQKSVTEEQTEEEDNLHLLPSPVDDVQVTIKRKPSKPPTVEEHTDEVTIRKLRQVRKTSKPDIPEYTDVANVTFRPKITKTKEDVEQEFKIQLDAYAEEEVSMSGKIKLKKQRPKTYSEEAGEGTIKITKEIEDEGPTIEEIIDEQDEEKVVSSDENEESFQVPLKPKKVTPYSIEEKSTEITIKKSKKPPLPEHTDVESVTIKPKSTHIREDIEQEFNIHLDSYAEEEVSMSGKIKLKKQRPSTYSEETGECSIKISQEIESEGPAIEEIIDEGSDAEELPYDNDLEESFHVPLKIKRKDSYSVHDEVEEEVKLDLRKAIKQQSFEEESLSLSLKPKRKPPHTFEQEEVSLSITQESEKYFEREDSVPSPLYIAVYSYSAEADQAMDLVEGEKIYVLDNQNNDWWYVKKNLVEEKGWVPARYLMTEPEYKIYLQRRLNEKIDKLPVFEKPKPEEKAMAPKFIEKLQPQQAKDGQTVQFECQVEGFPKPQITWFRQTQIIKPSQDFQMFFDDDNVATLIITEVFPEDAGTFTCVAKNSAGFASSTTELVVEGPLSDHGSEGPGISRKSASRESSVADILEGIPPTFFKKPGPICIDEEFDVDLECRLVAIPEPEISWTLNGKPLGQEHNVTIATTSEKHIYSTKVKMKSARKEQAGILQVTAKNREGEARLPIVLKVKSTQNETPLILQPLKNVTVKPNEPVKLSTRILGNPPPTVTWYKNNVPIQKSLPNKKDDVYTYAIKSPTENDSAEYTAKAVNVLGTAETSCTLTVEEFPSLKSEPPLFIERFQGVTVPENGTLVLRARVIGNPEPEIVWLRNNEIIVPNTRTNVYFDGENTKLTINDVNSEEDTGNYKCIATNPLGKASHGAKINVEVDKVKFVRKLKKTVEITEHEPLTLECETSHTVPTKWFHNDNELSGMDHRVIIQEGKVHKLIIKNATLKDSGSYKCTVKSEKTESKVIVKETKPEFLRKLEDYEATEKQIAILEVEVTSETAEVNWFKDGTPIEKTDTKYKIEKDGGVRRLLIRSASIHDEGEYSCTLTDEQCSAELTVIELPPEIISKMEDQTVMVNEKVAFEIELTKGDALVKWFKDGKELQFSEHVQLSIDGKRQKLKIYNSQPEDQGVYSCEVGNQKSSAKLTVIEPKLEFTKTLPPITRSPETADATFVVEVSRPDAEVTWLKDGVKIEESPRHTIIVDKNVRKLIVKNVTPADQAKYTCTLGDLKTESKLKVEEKEPQITIDQNEKIYRIKKGEDVTMNVKFTSAVKPTDEWSVDKKVIKKSKRFEPKLSEDSASLTIRKLEMVDAADYTLRLKNKTGEASADLTLVVIDVPSKPGKPEPIETTDSTVTLHWKTPESDGNAPVTNYTVYYKNSKTPTWTKMEESDSTTIKIPLIEKNEKYVFRVTAANEVGSSEPSDESDEIQLVATIVETKPEIVEPLQNITTGLKQKIALSCIVSGLPTPKIEWYKNGKVIKSKRITHENNVTTYVIEETDEETTATYSIRATNNAGFAESNCKVKIEETPKLKVEETEITQTLKVSETWKVEAKFSGYPKPEINWKKNKTQITSTKYSVEESSTIIKIAKVERNDSGTYTVYAENSAGSASTEVKLTVTDKPGPPEGPLTTTVNKTETVTISWKPPLDDGGAEISKYIIEQCLSDDKKWTKIADVEKDITSYEIQNLNINTEYSFRVIAQNAVGKSEPLEGKPIIITPEFEKPSPPRGPLEVSGMTANSFTISWKPSESDGGSPILEYIIEMKEAKTTEFKKVGSSKGDITNFAVNYLAKNKGYNFKITARNAAGLSEPFIPDDTIVAGSRITPPSAPENLQVTEATSRSATITWEPPLNNGGAEITGYIIEKKLEYMPKWEKIATLEATTLTYTFTKLKEKSEYVFRVFAENSVGLSTPATTKPVKLQTHATVPSPPTAPLEIRAIGPNAFVVEWGIPESDGGSPLTGYNIAIRDTKKTMWMEIGRVPKGVQKFTIRDLQEDHEYLVRIFARNEIGLSDPLESDEPFKVLPSTEPDQDEFKEVTEQPTSYSTEPTTSWLREHNMDADIHSYAKLKLLRKDEYFFKIWCYADQLFN
ncbi:titin isoform X2 [Agrilus planipennis]|uniref:Titin isoform X2 n=1 Tax=Agrilus planipennis TaxID=224129 RepID=A0A7F5R932_AGRPL|nr:titin isoform X2 [Agrilus planipennis]